MNKKYTFPSDAVYKAGKKKERASKAIRALEALQSDLSESISGDGRLKTISHQVNEVLPFLRSYRKILDE